jgi:hypothetical protein
VHALPSGSITDPTPPTVSTAIPHASLLPPSSSESLPVVEAQLSSSERHTFVELQRKYFITISQPDVMESVYIMWATEGWGTFTQRCETGLGSWTTQMCPYALLQRFLSQDSSEQSYREGFLPRFETDDQQQ